jgi:hypothetical protein
MYILRVFVKVYWSRITLASFSLRSNQFAHLISVDVNFTPQCGDIRNTITTPSHRVTLKYLSTCPAQTTSQFKESINCFPCHLSSLCSLTLLVSIQKHGISPFSLILNTRLITHCHFRHHPKSTLYKFKNMTWD